MSHLVSAPLRIRSIPDLKRAAQALGGELEESAVFTSYQGERNKCNYRIKLPGVNYQVGIVRDGDVYLMQHDPFGGDGPQWGDNDGHKLVAKFGKGLSKLSEEYTAQVVTTQARKKIGWTVVRKRLKNGRLQLRMVHA